MEIITQSKVFQVDSAIVQEARLLDNYIISTTETKTSVPEICAVYFSSNYIYFPNNEANVKKKIIDKNKFEWWNLKHPKATKHIFIRDIYKQWYLHGINKDLNSIEKLTSFLKNETEGITTYFIGSSAGGYAAVLLGSLLNVDRIYAFNNQFYLNDLLEESTANTDPLIFREQYNPKINKYFNLKTFIKNPENIYYFHSNKSGWDIKQFEAVKELKMNVISVNTKIHGIPFLKNNLIPLFSMDKADLKELTRKSLKPIKFSIKIIGLTQTLLILLKLIPNAYNRWVYNPLVNKLKSK